MDDEINSLLSYCSEIGFGAIKLSEGEQQFCHEWNNEVISLCKSLPQSTQTEALLFFMRYSRVSFSEELNFFKTFYVPAWSIIYWLLESKPDSSALRQVDFNNAKTGHSMAMFLHALDDHLCDGQLPVTHLALLLRSQSWMIMSNALNSLADGVNGGREIVEGFIDDYYSSITSSGEIDSIDSYCDIFRKQMATWLVVPVLITKKMFGDEDFTNAIQSAYGSFGIAWRLLDDIKDIEADMSEGAHSAIYICLSENIKPFWDNNDGVEPNLKNSNTKIVLDYILEKSVIEKLKERICSELESAVSLTDAYNITGLANEFRCLLSTLKKEEK